MIMKSVKMMSIYALNNDLRFHGAILPPNFESVL